MHTSIGSLASRRLLALGLLFTAAPPVWAQTPTKSGQQSPPAKKSSASKTTAAPTPAPPADALAPKGFARVDVTPQYKNEFEREIRVAVLVAPSYRNSGLNSLRFTLADEVELKGELERQGYKVWLISSTEASADNIRKVLQDSKQLLDGTTQATLLFGFSGHGFQTKSGKNYLMTYGASLDQVEQQALPLDEVESLMKASGARRSVILVDACRNDPEAKSSDEPRTFAQFREAEGFSVLLSTRPGGFSFEDPDVGHGIFTYYVLEGLRGKAAGKDGYVTFYDLEKYVESAVLSHAMKKDRVQKPFAVGERNGDFLLATAAPPKPEEIKPPAAVSKVDSDSPILREVGSNRSFFALLQDKQLTLVDAKTLAPFIDVAEMPVKDAETGYRYFEGNGPNRELIDVAVSLKGAEIMGVKGRTGTPCPGGNVCTTMAEVPLLPGEKRNEASAKASTVKNSSSVIGTGLKRLGLGGSNATNKSAVGADTVGKTADTNNRLLKYKWRPFDLTANLPKQPVH